MTQAISKQPPRAGEQQQHSTHLAGMPQKQPSNYAGDHCKVTVSSSAGTEASLPVKCQSNPVGDTSNSNDTDNDNSSMIVCPLAGLSLAAFLLPATASLLCSTSLGTPLGLVITILLAQLLLRRLPTFLAKLLGAGHVTLVDPRGAGPNRKLLLQSVAIALLLGSVLRIGIDLIISEQHQKQLLLLGIYLVLLTLFHYGEYFATALTNPDTLDLNSYLLNNSLAYTVAISLSFVEFLVEVYLFPNSKPLNAIALLGLLVAIFGELIRKLAMFTAGRNFSHMISTSKSPSHQLITHGIYSIFRHPSYAGWFYWAVGTQILLQNPICFVIFNVAACQFFRERINYEEELLTEFFGKDYDNYKGKVKLWMPI